MEVSSLTTNTKTSLGRICVRWKKKITQHKPFKPFSAPRDAVTVVLTKSPEAERESRDWKVQFL